MTDKVPFGPALRRLLKDKENSISTHPTVGELVAYHDGKLPEGPSESLRDHVAICSACAKTLLELAIASEPGEVESGSRRAELWDDLRSRLREDDGPETSDNSTDKGEDSSSTHRVAAGGGVSGVRGLSSFFGRLLSVRPLIPLVTCVVLLAWGAWLQLTVWELSQPHVVDAVAELEDGHDGGVRGTGPGLESVSAAGRSLILLSFFDEHGYPHYRVEIFDVSDKTEKPLWTSPESRRLPNGSLVFDVPPHFLKPGSHTVRLFGVSGEAAVLVAEYSLRVN